MIVGSTRKSIAFRPGPLLLTGLIVLLCGFPCRSQQTPATSTTNTVFSDPQTSETLPLAQQAGQQQPGNITGTVVDQTGAHITGASVRLVREGESSGIEVLSDENGQF